MVGLRKKPEEIIEEFFNSVQQYVQNLIIRKINLMNGLYDFHSKAWEIPKKYKGNSGQMGFIPEYLVFESVKQFIEKNNNFSFLPYVRSKTWDEDIETYYFVDDLDKPKHLLCQGLQISDTELAELGLQQINRAHDITYLIKKDGWPVKAIFEVKSSFELSSLKGDIDRLIFAERNYNLAKNFALIFVGFKDTNNLSKKERELISAFTKSKNHFCVFSREKRSKSWKFFVRRNS